MLGVTAVKKLKNRKILLLVGGLVAILIVAFVLHLVASNKPKATDSKYGIKQDACSLFTVANANAYLDDTAHKLKGSGYKLNNKDMALSNCEYMETSPTDDNVKSIAFTITTPRTKGAITQNSQDFKSLVKDKEVIKGLTAKMYWDQNKSTLYSYNHDTIYTVAFKAPASAKANYSQAAEYAIVLQGKL